MPSPPTFAVAVALLLSLGARGGQDPEPGADGRPLLVGNSGIAHDEVADALLRQVEKRGIEVTRITLCDCSDHGPFEHAGISASFAYSGPVGYYHSPGGTFRKVRPEDVLRTGQAIKAFIKRDSMTPT